MAFSVKARKLGFCRNVIMALAIASYACRKIEIKCVCVCVMHHLDHMSTIYKHIHTNYNIFYAYIYI